MSDLKSCKSCGEVKSLSQFSPHPTCKGGVNSRCKSCNAAVARERVQSKRSEDATSLAVHLQLASLKSEFGATLDFHKARIAELELTVAYLRSAVAELRAKGTQEKAMAVSDIGNGRTLTPTDILG
ncbi:hypothetical protein UFOVP158_16 [uncultured Caudovirales phage]|uniref:Uncharacterized protein n=1 Tax=uncultured Caudovirales phage TaxID=2100421 RepID=A0A6J7WEG8_9CAUD|nr:hypothetical protein UFOVP158_16 [uncultured Caudovirales phage]